MYWWGCIRKLSHELDDLGLKDKWELLVRIRVRMGSSGGEAEAEAWERRESPKRWNRKGEGDGQAG